MPGGAGLLPSTVGVAPNRSLPIMLRDFSYPSGDGHISDQWKRKIIFVGLPSNGICGRVFPPAP